jgi:hypothetical protein
MLFLHENHGQFEDRQHDEMMRIIQEYSAWADKLRNQQRLAGGEKLTEDPGKVIRATHAKTTITDGPYAESKEIVGGFFTVIASNYDEACDIAQQCPHLKYGGRIEVRMIHEL